MPVFFTPDPPTFWDSKVHDAIPPAAVPVSDRLHAELLAGQAGGLRIGADASGNPVLTDPPAAPATVPPVVSRFQARAALMQAGLLDQVEQAVAASDDDLIRLAWHDAAEFRRTSPTIAALAAAIGLTDAQVDQLFITDFCIRRHQCPPPSFTASRSSRSTPAPARSRPRDPRSSG